LNYKVPTAPAGVERAFEPA